MTNDSTRTGSTPAAMMLSRGLLVAVVVAAACALVAGLAQGRTGVYGALAGAGLVAVFFCTSFSVLGATRRLDPAITLIVALGLYAAKVVALAVTFVVLDATGVLGDPLHRGALALTVIVSTLVWIVVQIVVTVRHREPLYDLGTTGGQA